MRSKVYLRLFALAFRCDLTRYASFALSNGYDSRTYTEISGNVGDHHGITHNGMYGPMPPTIERKFVQYFTGLLSFLLDDLKSTQEGAGTLLDAFAEHTTELQDWLAHLPPSLVAQHLNIPEDVLATFPRTSQGITPIR